MKQLLLLLTLLMSFSCQEKKETLNNENKDETSIYSNEEKTTIDNYIENNFYPLKIVKTDVLAKNDVTTHTIDSIEKRIPLLSIIADRTYTKKIPTDSIVLYFNEVTSVKSTLNNDKVLGKLYLAKVIVIDKNGVEDSGYVPILLNNRNNISNGFDDLKNNQ